MIIPSLTVKPSILCGVTQFAKALADNALATDLADAYDALTTDAERAHDNPLAHAQLLTLTTARGIAALAIIAKESKN
jgi:hypothetical protein